MARSISTRSVDPGEERAFFAAAPPGLEPVVARELSALGIEGRVEPGGVAFRGPLALAALAERLWTPSRLQVELIRGPARTLEELDRLARRVDWAAFLPRGGSVEVEAAARQSRLRFREAVQRKLLLVLRDALGRPREAPREGQAVEQILRVRLDQDEATLSLDAGGELLHRRGWRLQPGRAPLRETTAACLLEMAGWEGDEALVDPFCGAGTIPIEAARRAAGRLPGVGRGYAFQRWPALSGRLPRPSPPASAGPAPAILGADRDPGAIQAAVENGGRAEARVDWRRVDLAALEPAAPFGLVVTNPPWGGRVGDAGAAYELLGRALEGPLRGYRAIFLAPGAEQARRVHRRARALTRFRAGGQPVGVFVWEPG